MKETVAVSARLDSIPNFRDVAKLVNATSAGPQIVPGYLYRSGRPEEATAQDRRTLLEVYNIKTIIDLRTTTEHIEAAKKVAIISTDAAHDGQTSGVDTPPVASKIPGVQYFRVNLNGKGFERSLIWQLSYLSLAKVVGLMAFGYRMDAISIIAKEVLQPRGLIGLGIDTLEHSKPEIKQLMGLLADSQNYPTIVHCTQGKDRTGLTVILVLLLCGFGVDSITRDYVESEAQLEIDMAGRTQEINSIGLDESFAKCPAHFPAEILQHIADRYGSIEAYITGLGVSQVQVEQIRRILIQGGPVD